VGDGRHEAGRRHGAESTEIPVTIERSSVAAAYQFPLGRHADFHEAWLQ
jgi:hypothetical protein